MLSSPLPWLRLRGFLWLGALVAAGWSPARATAAGDAWAEILASQPGRVLKTPAGPDASREARLADGVAWLSLQPNTDVSLARAEKQFAALAEGDDDLAAQAVYLRARLHQLHYLQPDYGRAAELFEQLAARWPDSHWAQLGLVKLGLLKLYALPADGDPIAAAEAVLARISDEALQRDLHLQIGQAGVVLKAPLDRLLPHLVAADRIGGISGTAREDLIVQIGELSRRAGQLEQARVYFERYLREYATNVRAYTVQRRLEAINAQLAAGEGSS
ncbi:MAG: hypothetical protein ACO3DQ_00930 [Cephaloticoccus sp.]